MSAFEVKGCPMKNLPPLVPGPVIEAYQRDADVVYRSTPENIARLAEALAPYHPYLRGAPPGLPSGDIMPLYGTRIRTTTRSVRAG